MYITAPPVPQLLAVSFPGALMAYPHRLIIGRGVKKGIISRYLHYREEIYLSAQLLVTLNGFLREN